MANSETRRQANHKRFLRVWYGGGGEVDGRRNASRGRLTQIDQMFQLCRQAFNRDHYEFTQQEGFAIVSIIEGEVQKLRQLVQTNGKPHQV